MVVRCCCWPWRWWLREEMWAFSGCRIYDVVDDSLAVICQARLCPQVRWQPNYGVLVNNSFHQENSSRIGILTFGRCTVAMGVIGCWHSPCRFYAWSCRVSHCTGRMPALLGEACWDCYPPPQFLKSSSLNTPHPGSSVGPWSLFGLLLAAVQVRWRWCPCQKAGICCIRWD